MVKNITAYLGLSHIVHSSIFSLQCSKGWSFLGVLCITSLQKIYFYFLESGQKVLCCARVYASTKSFVDLTSPVFDLFSFNISKNFKISYDARNVLKVKNKSELLSIATVRLLFLENRWNPGWGSTPAQGRPLK